MKQRRTGNKKNWWKWAFLLLLALNIAFWGVIISRVLSGYHSNTITSQTVKNPVKVGTITTTKEQLNQTLASYLNDYQSKGMTYLAVGIGKNWRLINDENSEGNKKQGWMNVAYMVGYVLIAVTVISFCVGTSMDTSKIVPV